MSDTKLLKKLNRDAGVRPSREMTKMDKIRAYFIEGRKLSKTLIETAEKLQEANSILCAGNSREHTVKILCKKHDIERAQAYKIVREATELFGDVTKASKDGLRHIVTEGLMTVYNIAKNKGNLEVCERAMTSIARINGLYDNSNENKNLNIGTFNILFTTDETALQNEEQNATIDIPHVQI